MRRTGKSKQDELWLKAVGQRIGELIKKKGFASPYDFWVQKIGDEISRATLNYIISGQSDPKATTLRVIARALGVEVSDLLKVSY